LEKAVVLISGGLDSCVAAAIAVQKYKIVSMHVSYGQRTENKEKQAFREICEFYSVQEKLEISMKYFSEIGGSALTDNNLFVPKSDLQRTTIPITYVPFRNGNLISVAASYAETTGAKKIVIGAVEEDSSGYPDCTKSFFVAMEKAINLGTKPETEIEIITPIIHLSKEEIIQKGVLLGAPLYLTWSCYQNNEKACGACDSCQLRLRGFEKAKKQDPILYE